MSDPIAAPALAGSPAVTFSFNAERYWRGMLEAHRWAAAATMKRRILLIVSGCVLLALCFVVVLSLIGARESITVGFISYTNDAVGLLYGKFLVENKASRAVGLAVFPPQILMGRSWKPSGRHEYQMVASVPARGSTVILWPAPTNAVSWRLPVSYFSPESFSLRSRAGRLLNKLHLASGDRWFCPTVVSPAVPPRPLNQAAPPNRRPPFALDGLARFGFIAYAPSATSAAVGEPHLSAITGCI